MIKLRELDTSREHIRELVDERSYAIYRRDDVPAYAGGKLGVSRGSAIEVIFRMAGRDGTSRAATRRSAGQRSPWWSPPLCPTVTHCKW
jgi:hypothetical protein